MGEHARIVIAQDYEALSCQGAEFVIGELQRRPDLLMCVASGGSPLGTYRHLAGRCRREPTLFSRLRVVKLDEWGPLGAADPASCEFYVRKEVVDPLSVAPGRYLTLAGDAADPEEACRRYAADLAAAGPIDLCVLGLGANGHLGLNEPSEWLHDTVHVADLARDSQGHAMLSTARTRPTHGLTLGMGDILRSRKILLLVNGAHKREPLRRLLMRRITTQFPASLLWTHGDLTVLCDREAHPDA